MDQIDFGSKYSIGLIKEEINKQNIKKLRYINECRITKIELVSGIYWPGCVFEYIFIQIESSKEIHFSCTSKNYRDAHEILIENGFHEMIINDDKNYVMKYSDTQLLINSLNLDVYPVLEFYRVLLIDNILPPQICRWIKGRMRHRTAVINLN